MKDNTILTLSNFFKHNFDKFMTIIRGEKPHVFTRKRKINAYSALLQMFAQKGKTQFSELSNYYKDLDKPLNISTVGFYKARMNLIAKL